MVAQASTGLIETYFVARLGTDALAGMALVFPFVMLMQMISAGAMGGGISSAIARALGAGRRDDADALVLHALIIQVALGAAFSAIMLAFGSPIYRALGGNGGELSAALAYSNVVFAGNVLLWAMNGLANVIRGTGNMLVPALVICVGVVVLVPLSPCLIFGLGPIPGAWNRGRRRRDGPVQRRRDRRSRLVRPVGTQPRPAASGAAALAAVPQHPRRRRGRLADLRADQRDHCAHHGPGRRRGGPGCGGRLRHRRAPGVSAGAARVRSRRAAGRPGRHQYRRRPARAGAAHRSHRRCHRLRHHRGDRHRHRGLAAGLADAVQHRSARDRDRKRVSARRRAVLWVLRPRPGAVLCLAGSRTAVLAAVCGVCSHARRGRRRLARASIDRFARAGCSPRSHSACFFTGRSCSSPSARARGFARASAADRQTSSRHDSGCRGCVFSAAASRRRNPA